MSSIRQNLRFHGDGSELFVIQFINALLSTITLGIYSFWGRTKVRTYLDSSTELAGDRFKYHGTGAELLSGAAKGFVLLFVLFGGVTIVGSALVGSAQQGVAPTVAQMLMPLSVYPLMLLVFAFATNSARRYRFSRSSWRGIRFAFTGRWQAYLRIIVPGAVLWLVTLTLYRPFLISNLRKFLAENARFGSLQFEYDGNGKDLFGAHLKALLLTIPTLGFVWVWYKAYEDCYFWNHTTLGPARFRCTVTGGQLLGFSFVNVVMLVCTLGIAAPWIQVRNRAFFCENVSLVGNVDWATVEQQAQIESSTGEGIADGLNLDVDIGLAM